MTCDKCTHGKRFKPRQDEVERYGPDVMGCNRLNWEGYTQPKSTCEAFFAYKQQEPTNG
jgi:hypothetical protein